MKPSGLAALLGAVDSSDRLERMSVTELAALLAQFAALQTAIAARLAQLAADQNGKSEPTHGGDRLLTVEEAATQRLSVDKSWIYRRPGLPFLVRCGRHLRVSEIALEKFIRTRTGTRGGPT